MKLKLLFVLIILLAGGFVFLGFQETPVTPKPTEVTLKREQFIP